MPEDKEQKTKGFLTTLPGLITAVAALITAGTGLVAVLFQAGVLGGSSGKQGDPSAAITPTSSRTPILIAPRSGSAVSQGYMAPWTFRWDAPGAGNTTRYHLRVTGPGARNPAIDIKTNETNYRYVDERRRCSYVTEQKRLGWSWQVRAEFDDGTSGPWSEESVFDVERHDVRAYCEKCPDSANCR